MQIYLYSTVCTLTITGGQKQSHVSCDLYWHGKRHCPSILPLPGKQISFLIRPFI